MWPSPILHRNVINVVLFAIKVLQILDFLLKELVPDASNQNAHRDTRHELIPLVSRLEAYLNKFDVGVQRNALRGQLAAKHLAQRVSSLKLNLIVILNLPVSCTDFVIAFKLVVETTKSEVFDFEGRRLHPNLGHVVKPILKLFALELIVLGVNLVHIIEIHHALPALGFVSFHYLCKVLILVIYVFL